MNVPDVETTRGREPEAVLQFSVFMPNRLGRLHEVVRHLAEQEVHLLALTVLDTTDSTILRFVTDDPGRARELLSGDGFAFVESRLVVVELAYERQLKDVMAALLEAELNIHYTYPFLTRPGGRSALCISIENPEIAEEALQKHRFTVLHQGDISR